MSKHGRVLVAMSGGIDSTVTAMMLHEQGYEVVGITMKTWDYASSGGSSKETGCCSLDSINDAREISVKMGFHHFIVDIREEFGDYVIDNFVDEYIAGRTPNPCVLCNTHIKWSALLKRADAMDCEFIATGHYATIAQENDRYFIQKARDERKDQSYVLWGLSQECMERSKFPLGPYVKDEVRQMAYDWGYEELSKKAESYEICFVPDNDYRGFLKRRVPELQAQVAGGTFVNTKGENIGSHEGYPFYTIGQRKGLGKAFGKPMYVTDIQADSNTVVLGDVEDLMRNGMMVGKLNLQKYEALDGKKEFVSQVRYNDKGVLSTVEQIGNNMEVVFHANVRGVAPGQSAVFYEGDDIVGGGIILSSLKQ
ncbi:tRNA 2-thiouridine(34) synthase MnmA [Portibacter lacus]|uniref:tRNA-specific 2-thiouridylase MnmA n=1 Tax=Portibacter lacus TaxID=1099794 RepID=A0AA37SUJ8_9BACT|nr:tRNA 2-thiouridine(34) synthase MnmA [Portibacter lacus]GLR20004.1 tRNA-specific 2-thiouridylase MnmA [Portibacter lacus]